MARRCLEHRTGVGRDQCANQLARCAHVDANFRESSEPQSVHFLGTPLHDAVKEEILCFEVVRHEPDVLIGCIRDGSKRCAFVSIVGKHQLRRVEQSLMGIDPGQRALTLFGAVRSYQLYRPQCYVLSPG
jgi:hypothetical protein